MNRQNNAFKAIIVIICVLVMLTFMFSVNMTRASFASKILIDADSGRVLYEENADCTMPMASLTKIVTAITVIENCNLYDEITVKKEYTGIEGSSIYLEEGETLSVLDLLYGLMLRSGNDAATALACHVGGDVAGFAELMNMTARSIGANNSNFVNPHGLNDDNHYTTARDLAIICAYALKNETFRTIVSTKKIEIPFSTRNYNRILYNKNKMLSEFDGADGIKTGYTKRAGRCLASSCTRGNDFKLVCVVLNCPEMFEESKRLFSSAYEQYERICVTNARVIATLPVEGKEGLCGVYCNDIYAALSEEEKNGLKYEVSLPQKLHEPFLRDTKIGEIKFFFNNHLLFSENLYTIVSSEEIR